MSDFDFEIEERETNKKPFMIVHGRAGLGKAQPLDSIVYTPTGASRIGDLSVGDQVIGSDGNTQDVLGVFPQGKLDTYEVEFRDGSKTQCNIEHLWAVNTSKIKNNMIMTTGDIIDYMCDAAKYSLTVPDNPVTQFTPQDVAIDPYLMGVYLSDGCGTGNVVQLTICNKDLDILERVDNSLPDNFETTVRDATGCVQVNIVMTEHLKNFGFVNMLKHYNVAVYSGDKFIPREYIYNSVGTRVDVLRGLMDGDGSVRSGRTSYSTTSEQLADNVRELVESLGGRATIGTYDRSSEGKSVEYRVNVRVDFNPFYTNRKASQWKRGSNIPSRAIESVTKLENPTEQVCIRVSNNDSLYITDNFIVTHNTTFASQAPNPIFIQTEDGGGELKLRTLKKGVFDSFDEVIAGLRYLYKNPDTFETLVIDSLDHLEPLVMKKTLTDLDIGHLSEAAYGKAYQEMDDNWRKIINACEKIVVDHDKLFIGIAHSAVRTVNDPTVEPYDSFEMKLGKRAGPLWIETADTILFINNPVVVDEKTGRPKGGSTVVAYTRPSAAYEAKTRFQKMPGMIPLTAKESFAKVGQYISTLNLEEN